MAKVAVEQVFTGAFTPGVSGFLGVSGYYGLTGYQGVTGAFYDSTKINLGTLMRLESGPNATDNYISTAPIVLARPADQAPASTWVNFVSVITWSSRYNWIFLGDNAAIAATRVTRMYIHDKVLDTMNYQGYITWNFVTNTGNKTMRGLDASLFRHNTGTITSTGTTTITGSGTSFLSDRIAVGSRIGFGSTDPTQIEKWYEIATITNNTTLTTTFAPLAFGNPTKYVIEDLRLYSTMTNATTAFGGVFLIKGLRPEIFTPTGLNIAEAASADNLRVIYRIGDLTMTNTAPCGIALDTDAPTPTNQDCWVLDTATTAPKVYRYNLRASLTGIVNNHLNAYVSVTPTAFPVLASAALQNNNGIIATVGHGSASGIKSLYYATATNIYRGAITGINAGATGWNNDRMQEYPTGFTGTFVATAGFYTVEYGDMLDRLFIPTSSSKLYVTRYNTGVAAFDHTIFIDSKQQDQSLEDSSAFPFPNTISSPMVIRTANGYSYVVRNTGATVTNQLYVVPLGADWQYANTTGQRIVTPMIPTTNVNTYYKAITNYSKSVGSGGLTMPVEPFRMYARVTGINDNTGVWNGPLGEDGSLLGVTGISSSTGIQFMYEFRTLGQLGIPPKLYSTTVIYEDTTTDSHFQPSVKWSDVTNKKIAWRFSSQLGSGFTGPDMLKESGYTGPDLVLRLYDATTGNLLYTDSTNSPTGITPTGLWGGGLWEKSINDGITWAAYDYADLGVTGAFNTTYIRYSPRAGSTGAVDNIKIEARLTRT